MQGKNSRQQDLRAARARTSLAGVLGLGRLDRFVAQAGLDMTFATLRTGLVIGLGATAMGVAGVGSSSPSSLRRS